MIDGAHTVKEVKESREMGARYMTFEELLKDEREEGRLEGREDGVKALVETLQELGNPSEMAVGIVTEKFEVDLKTAEEYLKKYWK